MSDLEWDCDEGEPDAHWFTRPTRASDHGLADYVKDTAFALGRAQAELARNIEAAPRQVFLLWNGHTCLLGIFGTKQKADQEMEAFLGHHPEADLWVESRVVHS